MRKVVALRQRQELIRMRANMIILTCLVLLPAIFGNTEKNETTFVPTREWQTIKRGKLNYYFLLLVRTFWDYFFAQLIVLFLRPRQSNLTSRFLRDNRLPFSCYYFNRKLFHSRRIFVAVYSLRFLKMR